jgi:hypothetical protein
VEDDDVVYFPVRLLVYEASMFCGRTGPPNTDSPCLTHTRFLPIHNRWSALPLYPMDLTTAGPCPALAIPPAASAVTRAITSAPGIRRLLRCKEGKKTTYYIRAMHATTRFT